MNELRFLEVMGKIDDDLIKEAEIDIEKQYSTKPIISKRSIYAFCSVAAAAIITVSSVAFYNAHDSSELLSNDSFVQPDNSGDDSSGDNHAIIPNSEPTFESNDNSKPTESNDTKATSANDDSSQQTTAATKTPDLSTENNSNTTQNTEPPAQDHKGGITIENCYFQPFIATVDPNSDAYGEDELHQVDVRTADGFYRQLGLDEYDANGIASNISNTNFGGYIGKIVEVNDSDYHGNGAESQEPTLAGADVYYYSGTGNNKVFIIVKKSEQCSIFIDDTINVSAGFQMGLSFFNVQSADDIQAIEYQIYVPDGSGIIIPSAQKTITDTEAIGAFYELICQLQPEDYSALPEHIGTPQWLVDAWENYKTDPNAPLKEDYSIIIILKDGTVLQDITYQPYLGNGYIENMQELTPEQNTALRTLLG